MAPMVDSYIIGRLLKIPIDKKNQKEQEPSKFNIIYLGDLHTKSIYSSLINTKYYNAVNISNIHNVWWQLIKYHVFGMSVDKCQKIKFNF